MKYKSFTEKVLACSLFSNTLRKYQQLSLSLERVPFLSIQTQSLGIFPKLDGTKSIGMDGYDLLSNQNKSHHL